MTIVPALLALLLQDQAPERRIVPVREFAVRVESRENPAYRTLWVSRDGGKIWKVAADAGVEAAWGEWAAGIVKCGVRVPEDGSYDFHAQLGDALSNRGPEPEPGRPADPRLRIEVRPRDVLAWAEPRGAGMSWQGGQAVTLRWASPGGEIRERSVELQFSLDGEAWAPVTKGLDGAGTYGWVVPNRETHRLRLRLRGTTRAGHEVSAEAEPVSVRASLRPNVAQARALYDRARVLHAQGRHAEARLKYEEAIQAWADFGEVYNDLGKLHAEQKDAPKALEYFLRARKACPSDPTSYVNAARTELALGLVDDAMLDLADSLALGLDQSERSSVLAAETLRAIARGAGADVALARRACEMILKVPHAAPATREFARKTLALPEKP
jgi:tetratricopeptide (TPR) repeat protein